MQYLRCLYVMFLITGIIYSIVKPMVLKKSKASNMLIFEIAAGLLGGLWLFLLLKFFGLTV